MSQYISLWTCHVVTLTSAITIEDSKKMGATTAIAGDALKAFELTWVVYDPRDPYGAQLALCSLAPIFIVIMYSTLIVFQRDMDIIALFFGQLLNEFLNQFLKRTIKQSRPHGARASGSGMPSAHSQFIAFFAAYVVAYTLKRLNGYRQVEKILTIPAAIVLAALVCYSRVRLGYHTVEQVLVGAIIGSGMGLAWFAFIDKVSVWLFPLIVNSALGRFFYLRDISHVPDLIVFQHQLCHQSAKRQ